ncbi:MAG: LAO/AO transport system kinase [Planctomycetota bacterium]|jgi:LAO/AO transport system kinase
MPRVIPTVKEIVKGFAAKDRSMLARAITLTESSRPEDAAVRVELLSALQHLTGKARRVGISGVPGVGKSTFIEVFGLHLIEQGKSVAVLAVDPSSTVSGGSILGDKARMNRLAQRPEAFIRPSPNASSLGGVANRSRESLLLCEAFGFDVVLVETVGVGQSETMVADMVDFFFVLMLPGAGDELQGIKRGILELADMIAVNKADGNLLPQAREAQAEYSAALRYTRPHTDGWTPKALLVSALEGTGLEEVWQAIEEHHQFMLDSGEHETKRQAQLTSWLWQEVEERLKAAFFGHAAVKQNLQKVETEVREGRLTPTEAARALLEQFGISEKTQ